ncbi:tyrosine-type recombinase/integrase [Floccifex sp.]|uniref:tyrosine-type recombinase/integrase n=1 Tax=Floccifex sp. TaxID=2815810 RepID=UPI003F0806EF
MAVSKNENGNGWKIQCRNPSTGKLTTIRRNPKTGKNFQTKKEAKDFESYYQKNQINLSVKMDELFEHYLKDYLALKPSSSAKNVESWYKNHIQPAIGKRKVVTLKIQDLEDLAVKMLKNGYSINYINKMTTNINTICNWGVAHSFLDRNPVTGYKPLKKIKTSDQLLYWTPEEFNLILNAIPKRYKDSDATYIRFFILFGYLTGIRKGEQRALKWENIDFIRNIIHIDYHVNEDGERVRGRKNGNGYSIVMDSAVRELLDEIHEYMKPIHGYSRKAYVFPSMKKGMNEPLGTYTPTRWILELAKYCDLPNITYHGLRHSACSYWTSVVGLTPYEVADKLGDTVKIVLEVYADFFHEQKTMAANKIDRHKDKLMSILNENREEELENGNNDGIGKKTTKETSS